MLDYFSHSDYGLVELPFPTGSRVYGPAREDSDYDYVLPLRYYTIINTILNLLEVKYKEINPQDYECPSTLITLPNGKKINFIWALDEELPAWITATKEMLKLDPIEDREERTARLREFLGI